MDYWEGVGVGLMVIHLENKMSLNLVMSPELVG